MIGFLLLEGRPGLGSQLMVQPSSLETSVARGSEGRGVPSGAHHQLGCTEHPVPPGGTQLQGAPFTLQSVELGSGGMQLVENNMSKAPGGVQLRHENSSG